jgi:hypothetical protein
MPKTVRYVAVMEGEDGVPGSSRPVLIAGDPTTVERVMRVISDRVNSGLPPHPGRKNGHTGTRGEGSAA